MQSEQTKMTQTPKPCFHSYSCWNSPQRRHVPGGLGKVSINNLTAIPVFGVWLLVTLEIASLVETWWIKFFQTKIVCVMDIWAVILTAQEHVNSLKDRPILKQAYTRPCNSAGHGTLSAWPKGLLKAPITLQVCSISEHNETVCRRLYFKQITVPQSSLTLSSTCVSLHKHTQTCKLSSAHWGTDLQHLSFCTAEYCMAYKACLFWLYSLLA